MLCELMYDVEVEFREIGVYMGLLFVAGFVCVMRLLGAHPVPGKNGRGA